MCVDFDLSHEQELLQETTRKFLNRSCPLTRVRELADDPAGFDREWWRQGAELGWTSLLVPERFGGGSVSGQGLRDLVLVAAEMGRLASPGPLLPTNVVAAAISSSAQADEHLDLLAAIVAGDAIATWCFDEPNRPFASASLALEAVHSGDFVLTGTKAPVEAAAEASHFLVTARTDGGLTQVMVAADTPGVSVTPMKSIDLVRRFGSVRFDAVKVERSSVIGDVGTAAPAVERQLQIALTIQLAEATSAAASVFEFTAAYAMDRFSFGRPLASYQALKHRFATMKMWLEASHAASAAATRAVQTNADDAAEVVSIAKSYIGEHLTEIVQDCVQIHGGIGVTWDHDLHIYLRRITLHRNLYGTPKDHQRRLADLLAL